MCRGTYGGGVSPICPFPRAAPLSPVAADSCNNIFPGARERVEQEKKDRLHSIPEDSSPSPHDARDIPNVQLGEHRPLDVLPTPNLPPRKKKNTGDTRGIDKTGSDQVKCENLYDDEFGAEGGKRRKKVMAAGAVQVGAVTSLGGSLAIRARVYDYTKDAESPLLEPMVVGLQSSVEPSVGRGKGGHEAE